LRTRRQRASTHKRHGRRWNGASNHTHDTTRRCQRHRRARGTRCGCRGHPFYQQSRVASAKRPHKPRQATADSVARHANNPKWQRDGDGAQHADAPHLVCDLRRGLVLGDDVRVREVRHRVIALRLAAAVRHGCVWARVVAQMDPKSGPCMRTPAACAACLRPARRSGMHGTRDSVSLAAVALHGSTAQSSRCIVGLCARSTLRSTVARRHTPHTGRRHCRRRRDRHRRDARPHHGRRTRAPKLRPTTLVACLQNAWICCDDSRDCSLASEGSVTAPP
jgi:hypothetical protein